MDYMKMLSEFHEKFEHYRFYGHEVPEEVIELRYKLINEEVNEELLPALNKLKENVNKLSLDDWQDLMVEISDGIADSLYVIFGTCISLGIPINEIFTEVHRSNMSKSILKDTKSIKGKTLKGENYSPPQLKPIFLKHFGQQD